MGRVSKSFLIFFLAALAWLLGAFPALAQRIRIEPVPPHVTPRWTLVASAPGVSYAPNLPTDVFRHRGRYYFYWEGYWYRAGNVRGPYFRVKQVPAFTFQIEPGYFKTLRGTEEVPGGRPPTVREVVPAPPTGVPEEVPAAPGPPPSGPPGPAGPLPKVM